MPSFAFDTDQLDRLTKLANTSFFHTIADNLLEAAGENKNCLALIYFDVDNFKGWNQEYGYEAGDFLLKEIADNIRKFYPKDIAARFSDDHFVVLCQNQWVEAKIAHMHAAIHSCAPGKGYPELKAGVYYFKNEDNSISSACDKAKLACSSIKKKYDTDFCVYDEKLMDAAKRRQYIADNIDSAIENGGIKLFFQPIMRVFSGKLCAVEVLTRWFDVDYDCFNPMDFIPVLEEFRLIYKLDCYVIRESCRIAGDLERLNLKPVPVSVNLSRLDFELCDIIGELEAAVEENNISKDMIHIEIAETALKDGNDSLKEYISSLREHGFQVWMDDFGGEYSTLNVLKDYDFDVIKIDMKFMKDFDSNPKSRIILSSVVDMAKRLGIQTLTEGVETQEQMDFLRSIGCDKAQGYFFSKPVSLTEFRKLGLNQEKKEEVGYYDSINKINIQSQKPLELLDLKEKDLSLHSSVPLAIVENRKGVFRYLLANSDFKKVLESIGIHSTDKSEETLNDSGLSLHPDFQDLIKRSIESRKNEAMVFVHDENFCRIQCRLAGEDKDNEAYAFLIVLQNLSLISGFGGKDYASSRMQDNEKDLSVTGAAYSQ